MFVWFVIIALLATCVIEFLREPRRLRVGILLLAALGLLGLAALGTVLDRLDDPYNETAAWLLLGVIAIGLISLVSLAGFLIANGLIMAGRESLSLANMLSLLLGIALLVYIVTAFLSITRNRADLAVWILFSVPPISYFGFVFCAFLVYAWIYGKLAPLTSGPVSAVVVLGAGLLRERVTPLLAGRLSTGQVAYERALISHPDVKIVVSGGQGPDETISEAEAMSTWLSERGVPPGDIIMESRSRTTEQNLRYSGELLGERGIVGSIAVVTSNYHAFRAATLMQSIGLDGYSVGAPTASYFWPSAMIREFIALLRDHARLNTAILLMLFAPFVVFTIAVVARFIL